MEYFFVLTVERYVGNDLRHVTYTGDLKVAPRTISRNRYAEMMETVSKEYGFLGKDAVVLFYSIEPKYIT